ncbi:MAG: phytanoyl-CoA dioxygenase family protein, partial [bacterium]
MVASYAGCTLCGILMRRTRGSAALWGPDIRYDHSKLNLKSAGFGSPVEWHQDWAFYPHTNDDLAAVGVMMDDMRLENGPLLCIPGSHRGPVFDHHDPQGIFCGALDPSKAAVDYAGAVPCLG